MTRSTRDSAPAIVLPKTCFPSQEKSFSATYLLDIHCGLLTHGTEHNKRLGLAEVEVRRNMNGPPLNTIQISNLSPGVSAIRIVQSLDDRCRKKAFGDTRNVVARSHEQVRLEGPEMDVQRFPYHRPRAVATLEAQEHARLALYLPPMSKTHKV